MEGTSKGKLELIASHYFEIHEDLIYMVDFLNKNLKNRKIMFGISKDKEKEKMLVSIYEFE